MSDECHTYQVDGKTIALLGNYHDNVCPSDFFDLGIAIDIYRSHLNARDALGHTGHG